MEYKRTCLICGADFITYNKVKRICAGTCRKKANALYAKDFMKRKRIFENNQAKPDAVITSVLADNVIC
jgi:hypothetical protein